MGKLLKYCGEDNVLWGTDSIWYGSPQDQIQAFRTFQISADLRAKHGYPEITPALRAKIFGLNGAKVYGLSAAEVKKYTSRDRRKRPRTRSGPSQVFSLTDPRREENFSTCSAAATPPNLPFAFHLPPPAFRLHKWASAHLSWPGFGAILLRKSDSDPNYSRAD